MNLKHRHEEVFEELKEYLEVLAGGYPVAEMSSTYEQIEECFKALACCHLLRNADPDKFQRDLVRAAFARRDFLLRCEAEKNENDHRRARSRSGGVFAALAAADVDLASEVSALSPKQWLRDGEYVDDFAYHIVLHHLLMGADQPTLEMAVAAYEEALDGRNDARLNICVALVARDGATFEDAFRALVAAQAAQMDEERPGKEAISTFEPQSLVFVEGLALLRLAERAGIATSTEYPPLCPAMARVAPLGQRLENILAEL
jgi:Immunity protein 49